MQRYFLELAYKGTSYHGWQTQNNAITVQSIIEEKLKIIFSQNIETVGCGRTDAGVHASQFFAHFDLENSIEDSEKIIYQMNAILPDDIKTMALHKVLPDAHARFDATSRSYSYYFAKEKNIYLNEYSWHYPTPLNIEGINELCKELLIHKDYGCFSKSGGQQFTNICNIFKAEISEHDTFYRFQISANRFLRGMVRAIVGTMIDFNKGKINHAIFKEILESGDRGKAGQSVPSKGLFLEKITYPYINSPSISPLNIK